MQEKKYITTPIYYVNDKPHLGHAYTTIVADILNKYYVNKLGKDNTYFLTGTDEHGAKIAEASDKAGISPQEFTDNISEEYKKAWENLGISYNQFIRTTSDKHKDIVIKILNTLKEKDIIYKDNYEGLYCIGCEKFLTDNDLEDGKCPDHNKEPELLKEENWFFKLDEFLPKIKKVIESGELKIYPEGRKKEVLGLIDKQDLPNFSISRSKKSVPWGIDLPWDKDQKVYVWIDALSNYITSLEYPDGEEFKKFWPADIQLLAVDILKFHAIFWPAILMALDIPLPKALYIHGFFTVNGKKMSKTLGNVISPDELVDKYGAEASKYLILSQFSFGNESDIKVNEFDAKYNADLVNGLGNLVNRITNMIENYLDGDIGLDKIPELALVNNVNNNIEELKFRDALLDIWKEIQKSNILIDQKKPWVLAKEDKLDEVKDILQELIISIYNIAVCLKPFMPEMSKKILDIITAKVLKNLKNHYLKD